MVALAVALGALAGCSGAQSNCTRNYNVDPDGGARCASGVLWHYCDGTTPPYYEVIGGKRFPCASAPDGGVSCAMAFDQLVAACSPPDGGTPIGDGGGAMPDGGTHGDGP